MRGKKELRGPREKRFTQKGFEKERYMDPGQS